ncbi:hypothetical protein L1987_65831 [Smallanthus sonchifolius]|uniref:Uncharacterized protein n=1 Tax=Smallanthus sonchifolius TaxID=185202 RepID=A0ACB9BVF9_9ASTR|nr:hypothetical protein L1987_65831 [Smallanthus sonchifolius]
MCRICYTTNHVYDVINKFSEFQLLNKKHVGLFWKKNDKTIPLYCMSRFDKCTPSISPFGACQGISIFFASKEDSKVSANLTESSATCSMCTIMARIKSDFTSRILVVLKFNSLENVSWQLTQWRRDGKMGSRQSHLCHFVMFFPLCFFTHVAASGSILKPYWASSKTAALVVRQL